MVFEVNESRMKGKGFKVQTAKELSYKGFEIQTS